MNGEFKQWANLKQNFNIEKTYTQNETETTEISRADNVKGRIVKLNTYNEYRW